MPEGPSIYTHVLKLKFLEGQKVTDCGGYAPLDRDGMSGEILKEITSHGKNFIFQFKEFFITAHLGLFGSMLINSRKKVNASFSLNFKEDEINFYVTKVKRFEGRYEEIFDDEVDLLSENFNPTKILYMLRKDFSDKQIGDVLLEQKVFAGSGNIIRNEALYRSKVHPESVVKEIPEQKLKELIDETRSYSFEFLRLMSAGGVKKNARIYAKQVCPIHKTEVLRYNAGKTKRNTFVCPECQVRY